MIKFLNVVTALVIMALISSTAIARDDRLQINVKEAMTTSDAKEKLDTKIKFYFRGEKHPKIIEDFGEVVSNRKTNALGKSDDVACKWVFLSVMLAFQDSVRKKGGNAVVDLRSYYKKSEAKQGKTFECAAGTIMAGTALKGRVVKL